MNLAMMNFHVDKDKVLEALVYVIDQAGELTPFFAGKILYFADVDHLRKFGRPITGDSYYALENGPVPTFAYDILKGGVAEPTKSSAMGALSHQKRKHPTFSVKRKADLSFFSKTDLECLDHAIEHCLRHSFGEISDETHGHVAWTNASLNEKMSFEDMLAGAEEEVVEDAKAFAAYGVL